MCLLLLSHSCCSLCPHAVMANLRHILYLLHMLYLSILSILLSLRWVLIGVMLLEIDTHSSSPIRWRYNNEAFRLVAILIDYIWVDTYWNGKFISQLKCLKTWPQSLCVSKYLIIYLSLRSTHSYLFCALQSRGFIVKRRWRFIVDYVRIMLFPLSNPM